MTMKFTTSRMANRIRPITTSPPIRKPPNAATTWPAAAVPSLPRDRISRVVATFSDSRSSVVSSSSVGKLVKSSGRCRNSATISTSTDGGDATAPAPDRAPTSAAAGSAPTAAPPRRAPARHRCRARIRRSLRQAAPVRAMARGPTRQVRPCRRRAARRCRPAAAAPAMPLRRVVAQLVAQRADGNAEDGGGVGAVAQRVRQRLQDQVALDIVHAPPDQPRDAPSPDGRGGAAPRPARPARVRWRRRRSCRRRPAARRDAGCSPARARCRASHAPPAAAAPPCGQRTRRQRR